jgi:hypothetical protein
MAVAFINFAAAQSNTCSKPSGVVDGTLLVAAIDVFDTTPVVPSAPAGWTRVISSASGLDGLGVYYRYVTTASGEPSSYTWTSSIFTTIVIGAYSGADPASPWDTQAVNDATNATSPSVTVSRGGSYAIWAEAADFTFSSGDQPSGFTFRSGSDGIIYSDKSINAGVTGTFSGTEAGIVSIGIVKAATGGAQYDVDVSDTAAVSDGLTTTMALDVSVPTGSLSFTFTG